jgi:hypothetical protein
MTNTKREEVLFHSICGLVLPQTSDRDPTATQEGLVEGAYTTATVGSPHDPPSSRIADQFLEIRRAWNRLATQGLIGPPPGEPPTPAAVNPIESIDDSRFQLWLYGSKAHQRAMNLARIVGILNSRRGR